MIQEQQILEEIAGQAPLYAMHQKGWRVEANYVTGCYEWVVKITCTGELDALEREIVVETRHANPETAWRRAIIDLQDRGIWPVR